MKLVKSFLSENRKIEFDFNLISTFEAGIVLKGHEVKMLRTNHPSIKGCYCTVDKGEIFLCNLNLPSNKQKLLLHKSEIKKIIGAFSRRNLAIVAKSMYTKNGIFKVEISLAERKNKHDKREYIKEKENKYLMIE